jgi:uncharacterized protein (TIGR01319 family)
VPGLAVSIDIGSTWTKGALIDPEEPRLVARAAVPTTQDGLGRGVAAVRAELERAAPGSAAECFLSSSAKGGLRIGVVGLVPELTVQAARLAAASAGGKVVAVAGYKLARADLERFAAAACDIVLVAGGTDGGDESYVRHNLGALAAAALPDASGAEAAFVYAGNRALADEAAARLTAAGKRVIVVANLLPDLDRIDYAPCRRAIAELFLERIVEGRGLAALAAACRSPLRATPAAMFDLAALLADGRDGPALIVDLGGATTDVYSGPEAASAAGTVRRGLVEPPVKRTVEGDLGLRVSARHALEAALVWPPSGDSSSAEELAAWVAAVSAAPERLAASPAERRADARLATVCVGEALRRHAGRRRESYAPSGRVWLQTGKDLRGHRRLIGSGGYLAVYPGADLVRSALAGAAAAPNGDPAAGGEILLPDPDGLAYFRDADYRLPLAANLALSYPEAAKALALAGLRAEQGVPA